MSALPSVPVVSGEIRALTLYDAAPADCGSILVPNDAFAPHLRAGEMAVIDPDDNEPIAGEIYVVKITSPREDCGYVLRFVQLRSRMFDFGEPDGRGGWRPTPDLGWMMHFQIIRARPTPKFYATMEDAERNVSTWTLCDGPLRTDGMRRYIVGRVVGIIPSDIQ